MMKRRISMIVCVWVASTVAYGQDKPSGDTNEAVEILKKVDAAAKAVKAVKYKATFKGTGAAESQAPSMEGTAVFTGLKGNAPEKYRLDATIKRPGSSDTQKVTVISDGEEFALIDHTAKKAYVDIDPAVLGSTGQTLVRAIVVVEFVHATPFSDELNGDKQEVTGNKKIGGVDCYEIDVTYAGGRGRSIWHFSKEDFLPRGRNVMFKTPDGKDGGRQYFVSDLEIDPKLDKDTFKINVPDGYETVDDFAP